jgi:ribosomal protein S18 acetylase RimI-like enzyme
MMVSADRDPRRAGTIWMLDLDGPPSKILPGVEAEFRLAGPYLAPDLAALQEGETAAALIRRFETGRQCYTAWVEGQLAAYGWVSLEDEKIGELNLRVKLLPGEAYIWDCATLPAYRRKHLYSALLAHILGELSAGGLCRAWIGADLDNVASQKGIARAGFHHVADLVVARVLTLRQVWVWGLPQVPDHILAETRRAFLNDRDKVWLNAVSAAVRGA